MENGYRIFNDKDIQRIKLIQQLHAGGLTLKECKASLEAKVDFKVLRKRLQKLDEEIAEKQKSRILLAAMLGEGDIKSWHESAIKLAPDVHLDWLITQGFTKTEALRLKWLSKNMNEHEQYMTDFMTVFKPLKYWGPGSESETLRALSFLPKPPKNILEIGCGKGLSTVVLAKNSSANITAIDNEPSAIEGLNHHIEHEGFTSRVTPVLADMTELPFEASSFDLILAEASAYIMGVEAALSAWRPLLEKNGILIISDLVWLTDEPSREAKAFWEKEYPDMHSIAHRMEQLKNSKFNLLSNFTLGTAAWENYYNPLKERIEALEPTLQSSAALMDIKRELDIYDQHLGEFGYQVFILKKEH